MATGSNSSGLSPASRNAYWEVVEDCLVEFHQKPRPAAVAVAVATRRRLESPPAGLDGDLVYHDEPFYTACEIAGLQDEREQDVLLKTNRMKYQSILSIHGW